MFASLVREQASTLAEHMTAVGGRLESVVRPWCATAEAATPRVSAAVAAAAVCVVCASAVAAGERN